MTDTPQVLLVMTDTPQVLLAHHLKTLKLPTFLREYDTHLCLSPLRFVARIGCRCNSEQVLY